MHKVHEGDDEKEMTSSRAQGQGRGEGGWLKRVDPSFRAPHTNLGEVLPAAHRFSDFPAPTAMHRQPQQWHRLTQWPNPKT